MRRVVIGLIQAARPKQWIKNLLVFAAPMAAGQLTVTSVMVPSAVAFLCMVMASSATYLVNDSLDVEADRAHPSKCRRPIAAGVVSPTLALRVALVLALAAIGIPWLLGYSGLFGLTLTYLMLQLAYVTWTKHQPVLDLASVAAGFVLRAVAGGVAAGLPISSWFMVVTASLAMFIVSGKRYSELVKLGSGETRRALAGYSLGYLRFIWSVSAAIAVTFYVLWAVEIGAAGGSWAAQMSAVPFSLVLLVYARDVDTGDAQAPEEMILRDRSLQALVMIWAVLFLIRQASAMAGA